MSGKTNDGKGTLELRMKRKFKDELLGKNRTELKIMNNEAKDVAIKVIDEAFK